MSFGPQSGDRANSMDVPAVFLVLRKMNPCWNDAMIARC